MRESRGDDPSRDCVRFLPRAMLFFLFILKLLDVDGIEAPGWSCCIAFSLLMSI